MRIREGLTGQFDKMVTGGGDRTILPAVDDCHDNQPVTVVIIRIDANDLPGTRAIARLQEPVSALLGRAPGGKGPDRRPQDLTVAIHLCRVTQRVVVNAAREIWGD
jgi:hypothetical protein